MTLHTNTMGLNAGVLFIMTKRQHSLISHFWGWDMTHLPNSIQRGSYWYDGHKNNGWGKIVVVFNTPQNNTEELKDVKRVQNLVGKKAVQVRGGILGKKSLFPGWKLTSLMRSLNREGTLTAISFSPKNNLLKGFRATLISEDLRNFMLRCYEIINQKVAWDAHKYL